MMRFVWLLSMCALSLLLCPSGHADDDLARRQFEAGVALLGQQRWQEAAGQLEASLQHADRPATRFNLVLVYHELSRPLEVVRHALPFLALPEKPERAQARERTSQLLAQAVAQLGTLRMEELPADADLKVDGVAPELRDGDRLYVAPGFHRLELRVADELPERTQLQLSAGQVQAWPRAERAPEATVVMPAAAQVEHTEPSRALSTHAVPAAPRARQVVAWTLGSIGAGLAVTSVGFYVAAVRRADALENASTEAGFLPDARDYESLRNTATPLALSAGACAAAALFVAPRAYRPRHWGYTVGSFVLAGALLGTGATLLAKEPDDIAGTRLDKPTMPAGSLLIAAALPALGFAVTGSVAGTSRARVQASLPLRVVW